MEKVIENPNWSKIEASIEGWTIPESLQTVIDLVNQGDDISDEQAKEWLEYYLFIISDNYTLTPKEMLSDHDWWLKCIQYHSGIDEDKIVNFMLNNKKLSTLSTHDFLTYVITYFDIAEMKSIGFD
jgi:hypothetical protein